MAGSRIKGITVEINGDTTKLSDSLKSVDKSLRTTQSSLRDVNKLLKLDPGNTELVAQKQKYLQKEISDTESKLKTLKLASKQAQQALSEGKISTEQYDALQREIIDTEHKLSGLKSEAEGAGKSVKESGTGLKSFGDEAKGSSLKMQALATMCGNVASAALSKLGDAIKSATGKLVEIGKQAYESYSTFQQMEGGVEKLYGTGGKSLEEYAKSQGQSVDQAKKKYNELESSVNTVMKNAQQAFKTSGMSANEYMDTATQFSASLISSLGGDTQKAAKQTDVAMRAMSDNVNTFGTNAEDVSNAFKGFSKQNYTMLDNLKLGYGGTKQEMERLIKDANAWGKANGEASNLSINSFSDVVTAIQQVQEAQGIAGTTSREAATTIEGSMTMAKAAWENFQTALGGGGDVKQATKDLAESVTAVFDNMLPEIEAVIDGIVTALPELAEKFAPLAGKIGDAIKKHAPDIVDSLKEFISTGLKLASDNAPGALKFAVSLIKEIGSDLIEHAPDIVDSLSTVLSTVTDYARENLPGMISELLQQLPDIISSAVGGAGDILSAIFPGASEAISSAVEFINGTVVPALSTVFTWIDKNKSALADAMIVVGTVVATIKILTGILKGVELAMAALNAVMALNPIVLIVAAIAGLVAAFVILWNKCDAFRNFWLGLWDGIKSAFSAWCEGIQELWSALSDAISTIVNAIQTVVTTVWDAVKTAVITVVSTIKTGVENAWNGIRNTTKAVFDAVKNFVTTVWNGIKTAISTVVNAIKSAVEAAWNGIKTATSTIFNGVKSVVTTVWNAIKSAVEAVVKAVKSAVETAWNGIKSVTETIFNGVKSVVESVWNGISSAISGVVNGIKSIVQSAWDTVSSVVKNISNAFSDLISSALGWGHDLISNLVSGLWDKMSSVIDAASNIGQAIYDHIHFSEPDKGPLKNFHTFMPDMIDLMVHGIKKNQKKVGIAASGLAAELSSGISPNATVKSVLTEGINSGGNVVYNNQVYNNQKTLNQTNNSPKALSRLEIYRQTNMAVSRF